MNLEKSLADLKNIVEVQKVNVSEKMKKVAFLEKELEISKNDAYDLIFQKD